MNKVYLGIITVLASVCIAAGQTQTSAKQAPLADEGRQVTLASGTSISAVLQKTLDVNNARVGDQISLKTTQSIRQNGEVVVPKGSTLIGRVTEVQRRTKENAQSRIGMVFEKIEGKQISMPLSATIVSITNVAAGASASDSLMTNAGGSSQTTGSTSSTSGGGLLGGVTNTVGGLVGTTTQTVGTVANSGGQTLGTTTGAVGRGLSGLQISASASGSASSSTTLSSANKNLRVEKGATFHIRAAN
jgi:hypothetical protein